MQTVIALGAQFAHDVVAIHHKGDFSLVFFWASHDKYNIHVINKLVHLIKYNTLISLEIVSAQLGMS